MTELLSLGSLDLGYICYTRRAQRGRCCIGAWIGVVNAVAWYGYGDLEGAVSHVVSKCFGAN